MVMELRAQGKEVLGAEENRGQSRCGLSVTLRISVLAWSVDPGADVPLRAEEATGTASSTVWGTEPLTGRHPFCSSHQPANGDAHGPC